MYEALRRRKDGGLLFVNVSRSVTRETPDGARHILYSKRDVTHLKVARDAKLVETRFGALLESTPDATLIVNAMGRIVLANSQAACSHHGTGSGAFRAPSRRPDRARQFTAGTPVWLSARRTPGTVRGSSGTGALPRPSRAAPDRFLQSAPSPGDGCGAGAVRSAPRW